MWFSTRLNLEDIQGISDKDPKLVTACFGVLVNKIKFTN